MGLKVCIAKEVHVLLFINPLNCIPVDIFKIFSDINP